MRQAPMPAQLQRSFSEDTPYVAPDFAMFNIVRRCNAGCQYCTDWRNDRDPRTDPNLSSIKRIIDGLAVLGVRRIAFSGGEPFLRRDLVEIVSHAKARGLNFGVITNGTAATRDRLASICQLVPEFIGVSLDSLDAGRMTAIRRLPLARVESTISILCELRDEAISPFNITLQVTVMKDNIRDLTDIARLAADRRISVSYQPVHFAGSGTPDTIQDVLWPDEEDLTQLDDVVETLIQMRAEGVAIKNRTEFLRQMPHFFRSRTFYPDGGCTVAYTDVVIDTDFGLRPCWSMDPVVLLNENTSIEEAWFGEGMRQARRHIRTKNCPGCLYKCHMNKPHLDLPLYPARGER